MSQFSSRIQVTLAAGATAVVDHQIRGVNDYASIVVIPLPDPSAWIGVTINGDPTSAGVSFTNTNTGTVTFNVLFLYPQQIIGSQVADTYVGATTAPAIPADSKTNFQYRLFGNAGGRIDAYTTINNLIANPTIRAGKFRNVSFHVLTQNPDLPGTINFTRMVDAINNAQTLTPPVPAYPAARVFPSNLPFSTWLDINYWTTMAGYFRNLAAVRLPGDPRIGIDAENYSIIDTAEPTIAGLIARGYTLAQFEAAIQPFIDMLIEEGVVPIGMYPNVFGDSQNLAIFGALIVDAVGRDRCEIWWENTFGTAEIYRQNLAINGFFSRINGQQAAVSQYNRSRGLQSANHRAVDDDDELRAWGVPINPGATPPLEGAPNNGLGPLPPWLFDETRISSQAGTQAWIDGTDLSTLNNVDYVWYARPLGATSPGGADIPSVGVAATPISLEIWAGTANSEVVTPSALSNTSIVGIQLSISSAAVPGTTWVAAKLKNVYPPLNTDPWTERLFGISIPSAVASDVPLWFNGQNNVAIACLYYIQASDKVVLLVAASGIQTYDVLLSPARDTPLGFCIGRSGTLWRHSANGGAAVDHTTASQASLFASSFYGMGPNVTMTSNTLRPCANMLISGWAARYSALRSQAEFAILSNINGTPYSTYNYPFGRGT